MSASDVVGLSCTGPQSSSLARPAGRGAELRNVCHWALCDWFWSDGVQRGCADAARRDGTPLAASKSELVLRTHMEASILHLNHLILALDLCVLLG